MERLRVGRDTQNTEHRRTSVREESSICFADLCMLVLYAGLLPMREDCAAAFKNVCVCIGKYVCVCVCACARVHMHVYIHMYVYLYINYMYIIIKCYK